jgi:hypothetical protein
VDAELLIRPSLNDHEVVADLLAPSAVAIRVGRQRSIMSRLVTDAHVAAKRPQFAEAAAGAGIPFLIDPWTPLLQGPLREDDPWAKLPFGRAAAANVDDYSNGSANFIHAVVDFQIDHGATAIVPPYPYVSGPDDAWFKVALAWLEETRTYLVSAGVALPIMPILCGQLMKMGAEAAWEQGIDRFAAKASSIGAHSIGLCLSPLGNGKDSYHKVRRLFLAAARLREASARPVIAWRQGVYGAALVAAGLDGYETGIGISEQTNIRANIGARRPPKPGQRPGRGGAAGIYLEPIGRSISRRVTQLLFAEAAMRAKLMCADERCCPRGVTSTVEHPREHAVRSRGGELALLSALPARPWRLNHIATKAQAAVTVATQANKVLERNGEEYRLPTTGLESLERVAEELRQADSQGRAA